MGVVQVADAFERLAQGIVGKCGFGGAGQQAPQTTERPHGQCLAGRHAPMVTPELGLQPAPADLHLDQCRSHDFAAREATGNVVGLVFVLPRHRKGFGSKAGKVPAQKRLRGNPSHAGIVAQVLVQLHPGPAGAVDPGAKATMVAAQVAVFMGQHRQKPATVQRHQQWQANHKVIGATTEQAIARNLLDAGVELIAEQHMVNRRAFHLAADALQRLEQFRGVFRGDLFALRRRNAHPQRPQADP